MAELSEKVKAIFIVKQNIKDLFQELKEIFCSIDTDGSNTLTLGEVVLFLKSITDDLSEANIEKIFTSIDTSDDKTIDFKEFKVLINTNRNSQYWHFVKGNGEENDRIWLEEG